MKECTIQLQVGKIQKQNKQETRERERRKRKKKNKGMGEKTKKKKKALLELASSTAGTQKHTVEHQIQAEIL